MRRTLLAALVLSLAIGWAPRANAVSSLRELLIQQYGLTNAPTCSSSAQTIGTSAVRVSLGDATRIEWLLVNWGASNCAYAYGPSVTMTTGNPVTNSGGTAEEDFRTDTVLPSYEHWVICAAAGMTLELTTCDLQ